MKTQLDIFGGLPQPKTDNQDVLLHLILNGSCTFFDFAYMQGFRTRISNLKEFGLILTTLKLTKKNKYGRIYTYHQHILENKNLESAIKLYKNLQIKK